MPQFNLPQLGESVTEGTITRWLKKEGDHVEADEALLEVSTDKVDSEIPAPQAGTVTKILAPEGGTVPVGAPIAEISSEAQGEPAADATNGAPAGEEGEAEQQAATDQGQVAPPAHQGQGDVPGRQDLAKGPQSSPRVLSPLVRKLAAEKNIDLAGVQGSGTAGRITRDDVLRHAGDGTAAERADAGPAANGGRSALSASPGTTPAKGSVVHGKRGSEERLPLSNMRRLIAEHMVASVHETTRAWTTIEVDMSAVGKLRKAAGPSFKSTFGYSLTWTPFVARALTQALLEYPAVNSSWNGDGSITKKHYVNLGIAVALEQGLIVPVIKGADGMNLLGIAGAIREMAQKARNKKLSADDIREGTFTLTNPGPFGSVMSVPIINRGEAAILAFDSIVKRPVVVTTPDGADSIGIREMVFLSLSWDHRLIDGAEAAQFLSRLKDLLEEPHFTNDLAPYLG